MSKKIILSDAGALKNLISEILRNGIKLYTSDTIRLLDQAFSEVEEEKWKLKDGETVWEISGTGDVFSETYTGDHEDYFQGRIDFGTCFRTKEEAEARKQQILNLK